jgi:hypothetical protein
VPQVINLGAKAMCPTAMTPGGPLPPVPIVATPGGKVNAKGPPVLTIFDSTPANISTFGSCMSPKNPAFISATSAASGVPTPVPCIPALTPWMPGASKVMAGSKPVLTMGSTCTCGLGTGPITIADPGTAATVSAT